MTTKYLPIIFGPDSVRAILDGTKTQTRRVVKPQPIEKRNPYDPDITTVVWHKNKNCIVHTTPQGLIPENPFAKEPGDRLWVRETWAASSEYNKRKPSELPDDLQVWYKAGGERYEDGSDARWYRLLGRGRWRPGIYMPRWASRLTLEITAVRVERLQDIDRAGATAEGFVSSREGGGWFDERVAFAEAWDAINGKRWPWDSDPWVWVVEFVRVDT